MSQRVSQIYKSADLQRYEHGLIDLYLQMSAGAPSLLGSMIGYPVAMGCATNAGALTQTAIDTFLGSTNEVIAGTAFGATAMGTDSLGFVINCGGQIASAQIMEAWLWVATEIADAVFVSSSALTDALTTAFAVTTAGNLYGRVVLAGLDAATTTPVHIKIAYQTK